MTRREVLAGIALLAGGTGMAYGTKRTKLADINTVLAHWITMNAPTLKVWSFKLILGWQQMMKCLTLRETRTNSMRHPIHWPSSSPFHEQPSLDRPTNTSLTAYTAGLIIEKATRHREHEFAREALFAPLGIEQFSWATDKAGHTKGQGNLSITTRDMARIGQMVMDSGRYNGHQILSATWIKESLKSTVQIGSVDPYADSYGYFGYTKALLLNGDPITVHFASGNGGNKIYIVPSRQMIVSITSSAYGHGYGQKRSQAILSAILST